MEREILNMEQKNTINSIRQIGCKKKREVIKILILGVFFILWVFPCFGNTKTVIRVGVLPIIEHLPLVVSQKETAKPLPNVEVKLDIYTSWTALEAAFRTGAVDAAAITLPKALIMAYEGIPLKIVLAVNRNGSALVLNSDDPEDLKGKIIGGSGSDTMQLVLFHRFLKEKGLDLGYDVRSLLIPLNRSVALLKEERVYGFCLPEPYGVLAEREDIAGRTILSRDIFPDHLGSVLIINPKNKKLHQAVLKEWLTSVVRSAEFIEEDKNTSGGRQTALTQKDIFHINIDVVQQALTKPKDRVIFKNLYPSIREVEEIMEIIMKLGILGGSVKAKLSDLIDTGYIE
ncbi:ABC transporter substrate-binding protein [Candidatus Omnitrophota bacterium]